MSQAFIPTAQSMPRFQVNVQPPRLGTTFEGGPVGQLAGREPFVAASAAMLTIRTQVARMARFDIPVLVQGEIGTGKTAVARLLHHLSPRNFKPFGAVNCEDFTEPELERKLFGSNTGAGIFETCDGGTVLLKEVTAMSPRLQLRLLDLLDEGRIFRPGLSEAISTNVRVVSTIRTSIEESVWSGILQPELYFRLSSLVLRVPPLRERKEEMDMLLGFFIDRYARHQSADSLPTLSEMREACARRPWPGNFWEFEDFVRECLILGEQAVTAHAA